MPRCRIRMGDAIARKNVLVQLTEAKRWDVTYGFGFEAQTGTPQSGTISQASAIL
jgi:outer membrane protein insertion porin family